MYHHCVYIYDTKRPPLRPYDIVLEGTTLNVLEMWSRAQIQKRRVAPNYIVTYGTIIAYLLTMS